MIIDCQQRTCDCEKDKILAIRRIYVQEWAQDENKDCSKKEYDGQQIVEVLKVFRIESSFLCPRQLVKEGED
jgi:hypothetical protein